MNNRKITEIRSVTIKRKNMKAWEYNSEIRKCVTLWTYQNF